MSSLSVVLTVTVTSKNIYIFLVHNKDIFLHYVLSSKGIVIGKVSVTYFYITF